jgi:hypothetical protein
VTDTIWRGARAALALGLAALLAFGLRRGADPGVPLLLDAATTVDQLVDILVRDTAPVLAYVDSVPPTRAVTALLASAAEGGADVTLAIPGDAGRLRVVPPDRPVARRRAALDVTVRGEPGSDVPVTVAGQTGAADTLVVAIGPDGRGAASVAVEPSRPGVETWTVRTPDAEVTAHAWVRPEAPIRVLVWSGAPGWESRWLVRALEASGMDVAVRQDLGRDLAVTTEGASAPRTLDDLAAYDVLALVGAAADSAGALARQWVAERGGGLLVVAANGDAREVAAAELAWAGPAEIVPLPPAVIVVRASTVPAAGFPVVEVGGGAARRITTGLAPDAAAGGSASGAAALVRADYVGRGRTFASGLETWPWVMEAGLGDEHEGYWESVVEWLAGGLTEGVLLEAEPAQPWVRWEGRVEGTLPAALLLRRPTTAPGEATADEPLPAILDADGAGAIVAFVPVAEGAHALEPVWSLGDAGPGPSVVGTVAAPAGEPLAWTAASLELGRAGARLLAADDPALSAGARPARSSQALPWIAFLLLALLAASAWTARRVRGRP